MSTRDRTTLDTLPADFEQARGSDADRRWAELVIGRFFLDDVNRGLVAEELTAVLQLVRTSGEGPQELFGDPLDYVQAQTEQWRADGAPLEPAQPGTSWWDVPAVAAAMAAIIAVLVTIVEAISGNWTTDYSLGTVLAPTLVAVTAMVAITTFETLLMRTRRLWAILAGVAIGAVGFGIVVATFFYGTEHTLFTGPLWWWAGIATVHVLIAVAVVRYLPDGEEIRARRQAGAHRASADEDVSDDQWAAQLAGILRLRIEMPEHEVRSSIAEARQHAATTGTSLREEFGSPSVYASQLPRSTSGRRLRERWRRIAWFAGVPVFGYLAFEGLQHGWAWDNVRWFMAFAFAASCLTVVGLLRTRTASAWSR